MRGEFMRAGLEAPEVRSQRACLPDQLAGTLRVVDHGFDLAAVAHDARIGKQVRDVPFVEVRDLAEVKALERPAKVLPFVEDRAPAQPRLESLEADLLEQA